MSARPTPPRAASVYFIGAGPGDAGLLTLRGAELLGRSDVVVHDARVHPDVLARGPAERLAVGEGTLVSRSEQIAEKLVALARGGKVVARVMGGDPYLFASGDEEVAWVSREGVPFEVVPGIVGSLAAGAYAGLPLSRRADASPSVALADARAGLALHDWSLLACATDAITVFVERADLEELARTLVFHGRLPDTPAAVLVDVALPTQRVVTGSLEDIARIAAHVRDTPVRLVVGEVVRRREPLRWFDARPLFGKRVLVTRAREQASSAAALLRERGAEPIVLPTIELHPPPDPGAVESAIARLGEYAWVAFTSANGVERAWDAIVRSGRDARALGGARLAAIGPATASALLAHGLRADVTAKEFKGEGLAAEMLGAMGATPGAKVLILRAQEAREVLPDTLRAAGCHVDVVAVYETRAPSDAAAGLRALVEGGRLDAVLFTSSSTVDNLCDLVGEGVTKLLEPFRIASIGPVTTATARSRGLRVDVTAAEYTLPGLVRALEASYA